MRKHTQIRIASAAMATLLAATQIAMPFPAIAADEDYVYCAAALILGTGRCFSER